VMAHWAGRDRSARAPLGLRERTAVAPFVGYREVSAEVGGRCVRVVVADTPARRSRGLRGSDDLGPYAGMLFVQQADGDVAFTMSGVTSPLDIVWLAADGTRVSAARMRPCPRESAACPLYRSSRRYRYALETPAGAGRSIETVAPCV
jgi:uncharacterized membrane protein (UPF0127 family)